MEKRCRRSLRGSLCLLLTALLLLSCAGPVGLAAEPQSAVVSLSLTPLDGVVTVGPRTA